MESYNYNDKNKKVNCLFAFEKTLVFNSVRQSVKMAN